MRSESPPEIDAPAWSERTRTCEDAEKHERRDGEITKIHQKFGVGTF